MATTLQQPGPAGDGDTLEGVTGPLSAPNLSALESLTAACTYYLETGKAPELMETALVAEPLSLSPYSDRSVQIHAHLGHGAEGMVFYASLVGDGWGERKNQDVAVKISLPFSLTRKAALPGWDACNEAECAAVYRCIQEQSSVLESFQREYAGERKLAPELIHVAELPLAGQRNVAVQVLVSEFVEGEQLSEEISRFERGECDGLRVLEHIYQSAVTLRSLLLNGFASVDSNASNFLVSCPWHCAEPFSVFIDFGGAERDESIESEEQRDLLRADTIEMFASECRQIRFGPQDSLIEQAVEIFTNLEEGAVSLTGAIEELRALLDALKRK